MSTTRSEVLHLSQALPWALLIHKIILQTNHSQVYSGCHTIRLEVAMQWVGTRPGRVGLRSTIHNIRRGCCRWSDMPEVNGPLVVPRVHDIVHGHENLVHKQSLALSQTVISCVVIVATPGPASCFCTNLLMLLWLTNGEASCPPTPTCTYRCSFVRRKENNSDPYHWTAHTVVSHRLNISFEKIHKKAAFAMAACELPPPHQSTGSNNISFLPPIHKLIKHFSPNSFGPLFHLHIPFFGVYLSALFTERLNAH